MKDLIVGIDAGTTVIKSVAFDLDGRQIDSASRKNNYSVGPDGAATQDLMATWEDCAATIRDLGQKIPNLSKRIVALAVTAQGDGTWMIDKHGQPVGDGLIWLDARAGSIVEKIRAKDDDKTRYQHTGTGLNACQQGSQLLWLRENAPDQLGEVVTAFHPKDWLYFKLTGQRVTDTSEAVFTFGDFRTRAYSDEVISILGLESHRHILPRMIDGTKESGQLSDEAAQATNLPKDLPVVLGFVDVICTAIGAGLYEPEAKPGCSIIGSTGMHIKLESAQNVKLNEDATGYVMCIPDSDYVAHIQSNMASTLNIDWALDMVINIVAEFGERPTKEAVLSRLDEWVLSAEPNRVLYLPYISEAGERGPFIDTSARASFHNLSTRHGFRDILRAVTEGLALASRDCYLGTGSLPDEVRLTGGAARSKTLRALFAAALNRPVRTTKREEAGAAGAAMMAMVSLGHYKSLLDASRAWALPLLDKLETPNDEWATGFNSIFPIYQKTREQMEPIWHAFAERKTNL